MATRRKETQQELLRRMIEIEEEMVEKIRTSRR